MIVTTYRIPYKYGQVIKIKPLFDSHLGNKYSDKKAFKAYVEDSDESTYFIGGGDLSDSIIIHDKRYQKSVDATKGDDIIDEQVQTLEDILSPVRERIIGLGDGNHENTILLKGGTNMMKRLCRRLDTKHLGYSWLIRLLLTEGKGRGRKVVVRGHHGWGGGSRTQGADLTKFSKDMQHFDADIFLYGHVHRKQSDRIPRLGLVGEKLISKPKLLGICGTFLKTYSSGVDSTYSERGGYPPVEIGGITVNIKPTLEWVKYWIDV